MLEICDSCTIREGLITAVNGGINQLWRDEYPAPLGFQLAVCVEVDVDGSSGEFSLSLSISAEDQADLGVPSLPINGVFEETGAGGGNDTMIVAVGVNVEAMTVPSPGRYWFRLNSADGREVGAVSFLVERPPAGMLG